MSDKAKIIFLKDRGEFAVRLNWKGKRYHRGYYDDHFRLFRRDMAERVAGSINQRIDESGNEYDPREHFASDKELQFTYAVDKWYQSKEYAPGTVENVEMALQRAKDYFKDTNIKLIRKAHIKAFIEDKLSHVSPTTKRSQLSWVKSALNEICDDWHLMRVPFPTVSVPHKEQSWLRREQQDRIISHIPERDKPVFLFMQAYGCRPSEACALMWDCVDFEAGSITFKRTFSGQRHLKGSTKSGYARIVPITEAITELLKPLRGIGKSYVFHNTLGNHYQAHPVWQIWDKAQKRAGAKKHISVKDAFRHSKISQLTEAGYPFKLISDFMGHRKMATTEIYSHSDFTRMKEMVI